MTDHSHIFFNKTLDDCRRLGARGGRAQARNRRLRPFDPSQPSLIPAEAEPPLETAAEAITILDAQFPWLRGAEERKRPRVAKGAYAALAANGQPQNCLASLFASQS